MPHFIDPSIDCRSAEYEPNEFSGVQLQLHNEYRINVDPNEGLFLSKPKITFDQNDL